MGEAKDPKQDLVEFSNYFDSQKSSKMASDVIVKFHSQVRWAKPPEELIKLIEDAGCTKADAFAAKDPKNGNYAIHIAAQNGHMDLVKWLIAEKADVCVQNGKGQTPLHMSIEYDFYFQSKILLQATADPLQTNDEGHEAMWGIDGGKTGNESWDNPVIILKACSNNKEEIEYALEMLSKAAADNPEAVDKGALVQTGMLKKKTLKDADTWDHKKFMEIAQKF